MPGQPRHRRRSPTTLLSASRHFRHESGYLFRFRFEQDQLDQDVGHRWRRGHGGRACPGPRPWAWPCRPEMVGARLI